MAVVLMDVDGTLLPNPSSESRFIAFLLRRGELGPGQIAAAAAFHLRYGFRFRRHVGRKNKAYLHGLGLARVAELGRRFVAQHLLAQLRVEVVERLRAHQRAGDQVALLTGSPDFIAAPLARALEVTHWCGTRCAMRGAHFDWHPPTRHPLGADKLQAAQQLCAQAHGTLAAAVAYADSVHDLALLERVGHAVAVHPDRRLRRIARQRGWECLTEDRPPGRLGVPE